MRRQTRSSWFESLYPRPGDIAQLVGQRVGRSDLGQYAGVAQTAERPLRERDAVGSIPAIGSMESKAWVAGQRS